MACTLFDHLVRSGSAPEILDGIGSGGVALAIWDRALPADLATALSGLDLGAVNDLAVDVAADGLDDAVLRGAGYPEEVTAPLTADVAALVGRYTALTGEDRLSLRLEVIETDACRRFHADYVAIRLLCTYVGPGSDWHLVDTPDRVQRLPTGAVAAFKGRLLLDPPTLLHRSPPIAATGGRRLMLAIDPATVADR